MRRHAFTLVEVLVVFAIIAILSAIVLPVLWQARVGISATVCISNQCQIGTAYALYTQDYDGVLPSMYALTTGETVTVYDVPYLITPYTKSSQLFYCPDLDTTGCMQRGAVTLAGLHDTGALVMAGRWSEQCIGYGYNFGPSATVGGGLLSVAHSAPGTYSYAGISLSAVTSPANTFASGDSYSLVSYSIDPEDILERYAGPHRNSALRHHGRLAMLFVDGHARSVAWRGSEGNYGFPANDADFGDWCADPSAILGATNGLSCERFARQLAGLQTWWPN